MRASLSQDNAPYRRLATRAGLPFAAVDVVHLLKVAALSGRVDIIGNRRAAISNRKLKNLDYVAVQLFGASL
jgi:hypothetical protein